MLDLDLEGATKTADLVGGIAVQADVSSSADVDGARETAETGLGLSTSGSTTRASPPSPRPSA